MRDLFVLDCLFGHSKKESVWEQRQRENQRYTNHSHHDDYNGGYSNHSPIDYAPQDFDDDLYSGMSDDDF